jgi:hypothetical protein
MKSKGGIPVRTSLLALIAAVALVLVAGSIAVGQSTAATDPLASGTATIQVVGVELVSPGVMRPNETRTVYHERGRQTEMTFVSSDARLSGEVICAGNREVARDGSFIENETFAIVNDDGRWIGQSTGLAVAQPVPDPLITNGLLAPPSGHEDFVLLRGEGAYEGLSALVDIDWTQQPPVGTGAILSGELPEAPELAVIG